MSRGYGAGKREREAKKAKKKKEKAMRRQQKRQEGPGDIPLTTAEEAAGEIPTVEEAMQAMEDKANAPKGASAIPARLFVGGLSWDTTEESLRAAFSQYGPVTDAFIVTDRDTGRSRGFGFVTMESSKDATKAIDGLDGTDLDGRTIAVNVATERNR